MYKHHLSNPTTPNRPTGKNARFEVDAIDVFLDFYRAHMPKTVYLKRNGARYDTVVAAIKEIQAYFQDVEKDAAFEISKDELVGTSLNLEVTCTLLSLSEVDRFCDSLKKADTVDIVPRTDGLLSVTLGFDDAFLPAPPHTQKNN